MKRSAFPDTEATRGESGWVRWLPWLLLLFALILRLAGLGIKPPHFDEGVNGWWVDQLFRTGYYPYDPSNYHGPLHFYVLFLMQSLFGREVIAFRLPVVLVNFATLWVMLGFVRYHCRRAVLIGGVAFAISTGMLFFTRYAIHEAWLVFGMVLALRGLLKLWTQGSVRGLWWTAAGLTLMVLTKETYLIHVVAFGLAGLTLWGLETFSPSKWPEQWQRPARQQWTRGDLATVLATSLVTILFFYSGGGADFSLLSGLYQTFAAWFDTGVTRGDHAKPWYYWLQLLYRHEWPALLGLVYCIRALFPGMNRFTRYLAIYGCGTLVAYTLIPYKTPWCVIAILWPFFILFGELVAAVSRVAPKVAIVGAGVILAGALADSLRLNFLHPAEPQAEVFVIPSLEEPLCNLGLISKEARYIYVQTLNDYFVFEKAIHALVRQDPSAQHRPGHVILSSNHPLPWLLGDFTQVGYYTDSLPQRMDATFLVVEERWLPEVEEALTRPYYVLPFHLRDGMESGYLYLDAEAFRFLYPQMAPGFVPFRGGGPREAGQ